MTTTATLVERLAGDLRPAPSHWMLRRLAVGFAAGSAVAAVIVLARWGVRPDFIQAAGSPALWVKFGYAGLLAAAGLIATRALARPGGRARAALPLLGATVAVMAALALVQLATAPAGARRGLLMGSTAAVCPWLIMALAVPIFAGGVWAVRAMAPTRLSHAGAALGLAAGAMAAFVYALSCDEHAMPFVFTWYGLGIAVPAVIGALVGRRLLRW